MHQSFVTTDSLKPLSRAGMYGVIILLLFFFFFLGGGGVWLRTKFLCEVHHRL